MSGEELLTPAEVAAELHVTERSVRLWCKSGRLPAKKVGRQWRVPRTWLDMWVEKETRAAVSAP